MPENSIVIDAPPGAVWEVLADGWLFPLWVVGACRIRDVEPSWPAAGSRIHHSVGVWPGVIDDDTEVLASEEATALRLRARAWPMGEAEVLITVAPSGRQSEVTIVEEVVSGPGRLVPAVVMGIGISWRNKETLRRLELLVEGRAARSV
ncbi:SRPBCC family protein [Janibacter alittae]|uniref:SRPBCC family protein n=1 Tax=Janibacter alittae TaxID=3115209 RepID=A0ABZ2MH01_9MICO